MLTPERVVAAETRRTLTALALHGLRVDGARREPGRAGAAAVAARAGGALAARARDRAGGRARQSWTGSGGCRCRTVDHTAAEPTGVAALLELATNLWGDDDPAARRARRGRRCCGCGARGQRAVRGLGVRAGAAPARRGDGPARPGPDRRRAGGDGRRGAAAGGAAAVLRRCTVTAARLDGDDLRVAFAPDPAVCDRDDGDVTWVRRARAGRAAELRALARTALDRVEPVLDRLRIEPPDPDGAPETCAACPLCALMAACAGSVPSCVQRLAEHAGGLVTLLRVGPGRARRAAACGAHRVGQPEGRAADPGRARRRRRAVTLTVGVDVGGTRVRAGVVDAEGAILDTARTSTPRSERRWRPRSRGSSRSSRSGTRSRAVGLALAGFVTPDRRVRPVRAAPGVARRARWPTGSRTGIGLPVVVEHDVNAAALAERRFGAAAGAATAVFVALGTGIGSALLLDGELYRGAFGVAPELGHMQVVPDGRPCAVREDRLLGALLQRHRAGDDGGRAAGPRPAALAGARRGSPRATPAG